MQNRAEIFQELLSRDRFLILTHKSPDGDTLGTAFALCRVLQREGKRAFVACSDEIPVRFRFLTGGYALLPVDEPFETVVSVDVATAELLGDKLSPFAEKVDYCIDHHSSNTGYAKKTIVDPMISSAGELLFSLLREAEISLDEEIARLLYAAISFDTGCFKYANVKPSTHLAAASLLPYGFDAEQINRRLFDISSLDQLRMEAQAIERVERYKNNAVTLVCLSLEQILAYGEEMDYDGLSSIPRRVEGTVIGLSMRETEPNFVKVSLRSLDDRIDVCKIAAVFGGGGHKRASGCVFHCPLAEAKIALLQAVFSEYDSVFCTE